MSLLFVASASGNEQHAKKPLRYVDPNHPGKLKWNPETAAKNVVHQELGIFKRCSSGFLRAN